MMKEYKSKRDLWISIVLLFSSFMVILVMVTILMTPETWTNKVVVMGVMGLILIFTLWIYSDTRYQLTDELLTIKCGPLRWSVALSSIEDIQTSNRLFPGFGLSIALSVHKLTIKRKRGMQIFISPENREAFLIDVGARITKLDKTS